MKAPTFTTITLECKLFREPDWVSAYYSIELPSDHARVLLQLLAVAKHPMLSAKEQDWFRR